ELFLYIEPQRSSLSSYSHKTRELLILACTEVESAWKRYLRLAQKTPLNGYDYTTNDYVRLRDHLFLPDYELILKPYDLQPVRAFGGWDACQPTKSLDWYDAYNLTKHDRDRHFDKANLKNCISAVCAYLAMFSVRFSPYPLYHEGTPTSALFRQFFEIGL